MPIVVEHSESVNWDAIRSFLFSSRAPETSMGLSDLDGFLTAMAIGPVTILPSDWLPVVWGGEDSIFDDLDEASNVSALIVTRVTDIVASLRFRPEDWAPAVGESDGGGVIVADWAAGFLDAIELRPEAWFPLFEDREASVLMLPILLAGGGRDVGEELGIGPSEQGEWLRWADQHIPMAVQAIDAFWKQRRTPEPAARSGRRRPRRLRRRDSYPGGSGQDHKRCYGAH